MAESLNKADSQSMLYILCMDDECFSILNDLKLERVCLISIGQFEDQELLKVKQNRSLAEYCWTCTGKLIKYVLTHYDEKICTYVDADMFFYSNPQVLIDEMKKKGCSVQVIPHRFPTSTRGKMQEINSGKNCVQFNTFTNENNSIKLLDTWINQCVEECSYKITGDQKYTDNWGDFEFVNISENQGAGVAPWNITSYKMNGDTIVLRKGMEKCNLVFYHFENIVYYNQTTVKIEPPIQYWRMDFTLIKKLYIPYLLNLNSKKTFLKQNYNLCPFAKVYSIDNDRKKRKLLCRVKDNKGTTIPIIIMKINDNIRRCFRKKKSIIRLDDVLIEQWER